MKIFANDIPFEIKSIAEKDQLNGAKYILANASKEQVMKHYEAVCEGRISGAAANLVFLVSNPAEVIASVKTEFKLIEAAGGIAKKEGKLLFIKRLGKWDLPKGKLEKGEQKDEAALREVEEECGVKVKLEREIGTTWHTYVHKGKHVLKCTYWYEMACTDDSQLTPQLDEAIEEAVWFSPSEVEEIALKNTYRSIQDIYEQYKAIR
ncbi:NUDIX domain-containing protein [Flammeovirgaceae bacterium SG7u.111]|nr:NUDIX domain-containing protein [Flammeovirgaceae bacterium SG7u.132]WPO34094.1 NUDIX domain-containing protein [Flammeovirgaceae bacterium SG7u.111]